MTVDRAIEVLMTDMGCYSCTFGCDTPYKCLNDSCEFKEAIHLAVERLKIELLPKMIKYEPQTDYTPDCPFCRKYETEDCLGSDCRRYKIYKDEPQSNILLDAMAKAFGIETEPQIIACPIQEEDADYARWLYETEPQTERSE